MFCVKCGTRLADNAVFCVNCGSRVATEQDVAQPVVQEPIMMETPVVEEPVMQEPVVMAPPVVEEPVAQDPVIMASPVVEQPVTQQNAYDQRQYTQSGTFQPVQTQPMQQMYQPQQPVMQQAFYNTPAKTKEKGNASVPAIIFLVIAAIASIAIAVGNFIDGEVGMGVMNICYFATSIIVIVYSTSSKKIGSILKGVFFLVMLVLNVIFVGYAAFMKSFDGFKNAKVGTDYYYSIILLLQYIFLYVYMMISVVRSFMGKEKVSYVTCILGYFAMLLIIAAFVIDVVSDINGLFVFKFIPIDLGIVALIIGDLFAMIRKSKNASK